MQRNPLLPDLLHLQLALTPTTCECGYQLFEPRGAGDKGVTDLDLHIQYELQNASDTNGLTHATDDAVQLTFAGAEGYDSLGPCCAKNIGAAEKMDTARC